MDLVSCWQHSFESVPGSEDVPESVLLSLRSRYYGNGWGCHADKCSGPEYWGDRCARADLAGTQRRPYTRANERSKNAWRKVTRFLVDAELRGFTLGDARSFS